MSAGQTTTVKAQQGDTLDQICLRHLGSTAGTVESALTLNRGLADLGPILPLGTSITLPAQPERPQTTQIKLWD